MRSVEALRLQATACQELGSPMYGELLLALADDCAVGGRTSEVLRGHEDDPGPSALALRLLGSVHRLVLSGQAPELARFYPSVGGSFELEGAFASLLELFATRPDDVREWLDQAPQTNEVGRAATLYGGLLHLPWDLPIRLFEIGSSGGLNLRADHFAYQTGDGLIGDPTSPVRLTPAWGDGPVARPLRIIQRSGSDISPVDVVSEEGRLTLASYLWPDQTDRFARLTGAMRVAAEVPATVVEQDAVRFVGSIGLEEGAVTVLWHSVMFQYLSAEDRGAVEARVAELGGAATDERPFAHLRFEPTRRAARGDHEFLVTLSVWPPGEERVLGSAHPHGLPVTWE